MGFCVLSRGDLGLRPAHADVAMPSARLTLLDSFRLACEGEAVQVPMSAQRVLAFLALHDRPLQRSFVAGSLWLELPDNRAGASLRSALWRLPRCVPRVVEVSGHQLSLGPEVDVDLHAADAVARRVLNQSRPDGLDVDPAALTGDLLPDWYEDWILVERESHRQLRLHALEKLCERLLDAGRLEQALELGLAAVAADPLRESAHRSVIRVHLEEGNVSEAMRQYRLFRNLLRNELGVEPSEQMQLLLRVHLGTYSERSPDVGAVPSRATSASRSSRTVA
jgi:DNA-binding SARP family transcriptional activator